MNEETETQRCTSSIPEMRNACDEIIAFTDSLLKGEIITEEERVAYEEQVRRIVNNYYRSAAGHGGRTGRAPTDTVNCTYAIMSGLNVEINMSREQRRRHKADMYTVFGMRMLRGYTKVELCLLPMLFRMLVVARLRAKDFLALTESASSVAEHNTSVFLDALAALVAARLVGKYDKTDEILGHFPGEMGAFSAALKITLPEETIVEMRILVDRRAAAASGAGSASSLVRRNPRRHSPAKRKGPQNG